LEVLAQLRADQDEETAMFKHTMIALMLAVPVAAFAAGDTATPAGKPAAQTATKAKAPGRAAFNRADANHDGFLTREEAQKGMPRVAKNFDRIDTDKDGKVSRDELRAFRVANKGGKKTPAKTTG
jgi:NADH dehydrogenase FAD-containing subunit